MNELNNILTTSETKCHCIICYVVNRQVTTKAWKSSLHSLTTQGVYTIYIILRQTLVIMDGENTLNGIRIQFFILEEKHIAFGRNLISIGTQIRKERYSLSGELYAFRMLHLPIMIGYRSIRTSKIYTHSNITQCAIHIKHIHRQAIISIQYTTIMYQDKTTFTTRNMSKSYSSKRMLTLIYFILILTNSCTTITCHQEFCITQSYTFIR